MLHAASPAVPNDHLSSVPWAAAPVQQHRPLGALGLDQPGGDGEQLVAEAASSGAPEVPRTQRRLGPHKRRMWTFFGAETGVK